MSIDINSEFKSLKQAYNINNADDIENTPAINLLSFAKKMFYLLNYDNEDIVNNCGTPIQTLNTASQTTNTLSQTTNMLSQTTSTLGETLNTASQTTNQIFNTQNIKHSSQS